MGASGVEGGGFCMKDEGWVRRLVHVGGWRLERFRRGSLVVRVEVGLRRVRDTVPVGGWVWWEGEGATRAGLGCVEEWGRVGIPVAVAVGTWKAIEACSATTTSFS